MEFTETRVKKFTFEERKKKGVEDTEGAASILESRFSQSRLFAQRELYINSKFSPFHARSLVSRSLTLLTLVVAHARELIVMNFVEYTFLLCLYDTC